MTGIFGEDGTDVFVGDFGEVTDSVGVAALGNDHIDGGGGSDNIFGGAQVGNERVVPVEAGMSDTIDGGDGARPGTDGCTNVENETD